MVEDVRAYKIEDAAGVGAYLAVVQGAADGGCKKPGGANAAGFLGFTIEPQATQYKAVPVKKIGLTRAVAGGVITAGDRLVIDGTTGKVKSEEANIAGGVGAYALYNVVARAEVSAVLDDVFWVWVTPESVSRPAS